MYPMSYSHTTAYIPNTIDVGGQLRFGWQLGVSSSAQRFVGSLHTSASSCLVTMALNSWEMSDDEEIMRSSFMSSSSQQQEVHFPERQQEPQQSRDKKERKRGDEED